MKKFMNSIKKKVENMGVCAICKVTQAKEILTDRTGTGYIDQVVVILIAVVLGALLLAGLYLLFGDVVMPTLTRKITEMFNYAG